MANETAGTDRIMRFLRARGHYVVKIHGDPMQAKGTPDLFACVLGRFVALEVKEPGLDADDLQAYTLEEIRRAGGLASVVHSIEEVQQCLLQ